jgi:serine/threonine protein kinase
MLVELHNGRPLFNGSNEHEQLYRMELLLGELPHALIVSGSKEKTDQYFRSLDGKFYLLPPKPRKPSSAWQETRSLEATIHSSTQQESAADYSQFVEFVKKMLVFDPETRIGPSDALKLPFCRQHISTNTPSIPIRRSSRRCSIDE